MLSAYKIILGTVQFGLQYGINNKTGKPGADTVKSILDLAYRNNITILDTAEAYGNSQEVIGRYHKESKNKFKVITKFGSERNDLPRDLAQRVRQNVHALGVESLYGYMFHSYKDFENYFKGFKDEILKLKKEGIIKKFGVSIYTNTEFEKLLAYSEIDFIQLPFNLLDNNFQRAGLITRAKEMGKEIHTRSVFLQGLFFKSPDDLPGDLVILRPYLEEIKTISKENQVDLNSLSLNYVLQQKNIDQVLIGVETLEQLQENINSLKASISNKVIDLIDAIHVTEDAQLNPSTWKK